MLSFSVKGLVLRETDVGDFDKFIDILSAERGLISVFCVGAKKYKSRNFSAVNVYTYAEFSVRVSRDRLYLSESKIIEVFPKIRKNLTSLSFAAYISEIALNLSTEDGDDGLLRLMLNTLYLYGEEKKPPLLVKAAFELRAISDAGFMPDLSVCAKCGKSDAIKAQSCYFNISDGSVLCDACYHKDDKESLIRELKFDESEGIYPYSKLFFILSPASREAMRYVIRAKPERLFSFTVDADELDNFSQACEKYLLYNLDKSLKSLELYKFAYSSKK